MHFAPRLGLQDWVGAGCEPDVRQHLENRLRCRGCRVARDRVERPWATDGQRRVLRRTTECGGDSRGKAIGSVLTAWFALNEVFAADDELIGIGKDSLVAVRCGSRTDDECAFGDQKTEALDLTARETLAAEDGCRVANGLEVRVLHESAFAAHRFELFWMREEEHPHVGECTVQRFVVTFEQCGNDVVSGGCRAVEFESCDSAEPIVLRVAAALVEQWREVVDEFEHRALAGVMVDRVPSPATLHAQIAFGELCEVGVGNADRAAQQGDGIQRGEFDGEVC